MILCYLFNGAAFGQAKPANQRWQQAVKYTMEIDMDVETNQFTGTQEIEYTNNSPDTLNKVFYHLYFNAFQPGSMMDVHNRLIEDPSRKIGDKILGYDESEQGFQQINSLSQDGNPLDYEVVGTILEVTLAEPILPGEQTTFNMDFKAQVPLQTRRSGRDNAEGIEYSMSQWYPKLCEYDYEGWHANPYIAREFYGVWGDFDVKITIDSSYVIGGSGYLQNPEEIGHGYLPEGEEPDRPDSDKLTWHFVAPNVHDFMWGADPDYVHTTAQVPDGPLLHFFYQTDTLVKNWQKLPGVAVEAFQFMNKTFGKYPYNQFSVVQGGDGGMEYPMSTLITGHRSFRSLLGVTIHEAFHSWYQGVLGTNESLYAWMDEGFTSYATRRTLSYVISGEDISLETDIYEGTYRGYFALAESGKEEPLTTHSDHFVTNRAYGIGSYGKGAIFLHQLSYIVGRETFERGMRRYFNTWKFKHPNATDFKRVMEKESGVELDWYLEYWINTTHTLDYGVGSVSAEGNGTEVTIDKIGYMPMPLDIMVTYTDGSKELFYTPLIMMRGEKPNEYEDTERTVLPDFGWVYPDYTFTIDRPREEIAEIAIDPSGRMADIDRSNNVFSEKNINNR